MIGILEVRAWTNRLKRPIAKPSSNPLYSGRAARLVWSAVALIIGIKAVVSPNRHSVWPIFASASNHWRHGESMYVHYDTLDMYRYSPAFAVAIWPLAELPVPIGGAIWGIGSIILLYRGLFVFHRDVLSRTSGSSRGDSFLIFAGMGIAPMAWNLQSNALVLGLMALGTAAAARKAWWQAAVFLAAPVLIKLWPLAWLAVVVGTRPRQLLLRALLALAAWAVIPLAAGSLQSLHQAYHEWFYILQEGSGLRWPGYRDLWTVLETLRLEPNRMSYLVVQVVSGAAVFGITLAVQRRDREPCRALAYGFALWLNWQLLLGPGSERNTYGMILPIIGWQMLRRRVDARRALFPQLAFATIFLLTMGDLERLLSRTFFGAEIILPTAVLFFAGWLVASGNLILVRLQSQSQIFGPTTAILPSPVESEHSIDERCDRSRRQHQNQTEQHQYDQDWKQPPPLVVEQEESEVLQK